MILTGPIAEHGMTIMAARADLELEVPIASDTVPLHEMVLDMIEWRSAPPHLLGTREGKEPGHGRTRA